jgi:hypothetical protein
MSDVPVSMSSEISVHSGRRDFQDLNPKAQITKSVVVSRSCPVSNEIAPVLSCPVSLVARFASLRMTFNITRKRTATMNSVINTLERKSVVCTNMT